MKISNVHLPAAPFKPRSLVVAVALAFSAVSLAGCSSGGGGGGGAPDDSSTGIYQPEPAPAPVEPPPAPAPAPVEPPPIEKPPVSRVPVESPTDEAPSNRYPMIEPLGVRVGIVDSGFDIDRILNNDVVIDSLNVHTGLKDVSGGNEWHGSVVASTISGGQLGNARLDLIKVEDASGTTYSSTLDYGIGEAALRGARVINTSFSRRLEASDPRLSFNGVSTNESYQRVVNANDGKGAVYVVSAGNSGAAIDTQGKPLYASQPALFDMTLIAVGSDEQGNLHPLSSFPGDDARLQSRTLAAPFVNRQVGAQGTSISAPRVAEYAAGIIARWPHLTAQQVSQRLLETARRDSALFGQNSCGASGTANCGFFYLGQGAADIDAALAPAGELVVPSGESVALGGESASASFAQLSGAYGDALASTQALENVAAFDALGRDYAIDLSGNAQPRKAYDDQLRNSMERVASASVQAVDTQFIDSGAYQFTASTDSAGTPLASRFDVDFGAAGLGTAGLGAAGFSAFRFDGDQASPMSGYAESSMMPMISFQGGSALTQGLDSVSGVQTRYALGERVEVSASHWAGDVEASKKSRYRSNRSDIGASFTLTPALSLATHIGRLNEQEGLLGAHGTGALSLGENNHMTFAGVELQMVLGSGFSGFAEFEQARGNAGGSGLLASVDNIVAREMALGAQWQGQGARADERLALSVRQPLRIESADASVEVPVGRHLDGTVVRETREASLSPSGRQVDIELGYAFASSEHNEWQVNLLHTLEPGHDADAPDDTAAVVNYRYRW
ncbi:S8 family serine peptidase [Halomonas sp. PAMB 3232]|uniref:S8 family peptidase n=1 Tax=Halomonas sp. PAMB 3232 TaxID=3075221 RepID=UPI002896F211|nr:S8 family serine peptidase [Halomonas sp. PAMB 3232]WNL37643.1 S8 family serine peptidase [Halomonas sp. PAMB 3232]